MCLWYLTLVKRLVFGVSKNSKDIQRKPCLHNYVIAIVVSTNALTYLFYTFKFHFEDKDVHPISNCTLNCSNSVVSHTLITIMPYFIPLPVENALLAILIIKDISSQFNLDIVEGDDDDKNEDSHSQMNNLLSTRTESVNENHFDHNALLEAGLSGAIGESSSTQLKENSKNQNVEFEKHKQNISVNGCCQLIPELFTVIVTSTLIVIVWILKREEVSIGQNVIYFMLDSGILIACIICFVSIYKNYPTIEKKVPFSLKHYLTCLAF